MAGSVRGVAAHRVPGRRVSAWWSLFLALAGLVLLGAAATPALASQGPPPGSERVGSAPKPPQGTADQGSLPPGVQLHLTVVLRSVDPVGLANFAAGTTEPGSPHYHQRLSPGSFATTFGASSTAISAVRGWLSASGLTPGPTSADGLAVSVVASAGQIDRALGAQLHSYRLPSGRLAYANAAAPLVPTDVAPYIQAILGLNDLVRLRPGPLGPPRAPPGRGRAAPQGPAGASPGATASPTVGGLVATAGPTPCSSASAVATTDGAWTANQLAQAYELDKLYGLGLLGQGVTVGLLELEPYLSSDIAAYQSCYKTSASVTNVLVDGGPGTGAGSGEAALDIEDVIGLADRAAILVYEAPNTLAAEYDAFNAMISADRAQVISTSWGLCEQSLVADAGTSYLAAENTLFEEAATQGQTVFAAAGDSGSNDCGTSALAVDDPAAQPYVTGVGGTSLTALGPAPTETVWDDSSPNHECAQHTACAGGGGISTVWPMPSWQSAPGVVNSYSSGSPCGASSGYCREVPDVTASADPYHGYVIYYNGSWTVFGGTSAAAPLWAALTGLVDNGCAAAPVGFINPRLYQAAATGPSPFNDITTGDNAILRSDNGAYPATSGYDMASGLGSAIAPTLLDALCAPDVEQISPSSGPSAGGTSVTITGTGFTPTSVVDFGATPAASVTFDSATTLVAVAPPGTATVVVSVSTAGGQSSTVGTAANQFAYGLPGVSAVSLTGTAPTCPAGAVQPCAAPGDTLTVSGTGFGNTQGASYVTFVDSGISWGAPLDAAQLSNLSWSSNSISFTVPSLTKPWGVTLETTASVSVDVGGVTSNPVPLSIVPAGSITVGAPSPDPAASGTTVTLTATSGSFGSVPGWVTLVDGAISWGGPSDAAQLTITSWSPTTISFTVPGLTKPWAVTPGTTASVTVTTAAGDLSNPVSLAIAPATPSLTISASTSSATPGESVTLIGSSLGSPGWVSFEDSGIGWGAPSDAAPLPFSWSGTSISFDIPTKSGPWAVTPGTTASVSITNSAGQFSNTVSIAIVPTGSITMAVTSPSLAAAYPGQPVTLTASSGSFGSAPGSVVLVDAGISWGGPSDAAQLTITSWAPSSITFTMPTPEGSAYQWQVIPDTTATVTVTSSAWAQSTPIDLAVAPTGSIPLVSMSPTSPAPGASVTLTGAGFGSSQGSGYVTLVDNGISWGAPNDAARLDITEWQTDLTGTSTIVFNLPPASGGWPVAAGTTATVTVTNAAGAIFDTVSFVIG